MALSVAEVLIRWRQEGNKEVEASTKRLGESVTQMGDRMKTAGAVLSAGLTAPLVLMGKQAIDAASDLNEATSAVQTVFGRTADEMVRFSQSAATNLGQSQQAALGAASALGALFQGVGLNNDQMAEFSQNVLTASGDLASFYNVDPGQALQNLRSGLVGEAEPLRRFGILLNEASVEAKAVELGLIAVGDEMTEAQKVQARYAVIMEQLGAAQGDFARTSDSLANRQRILTARMQDMRAEIGQFLLPYALQLSEVFSRLLDRFLNLDEGSKRLAVTIGAVAAAAGPALLIFGQFLSTAGKLAPLFAALTGPLGLVAAGVAGLALAWQQNWFGIRDITRTVVDGVLQTMGRMVEFFQHAKDRGLDPFRLAFRTLIVTLGERLGRGHPIVDFLQEVLRLGQRLGKAFQDQDFGAFVGELERAGERLGGWLTEQLDRAKVFGLNLLLRLVAGIREVNWGQVAETIGAALGDLFAWRQGVLQQAFDFGAWVLARIVEGVQAVNWPVVGETIRDNLGRFADWVGDRLGEAFGFGAWLLSRIYEGLRAVNWDLVGTTVQSAMQTALGVLRDLGVWVLDRLREVNWSSVLSHMHAVGGIIAAELLTGIRHGALGLRDLAFWLNDTLKEVNWTAPLVALYDAGEALAGRLLQGVSAGVDSLVAWFGGTTNKTGGKEGGIGGRIWVAITAAFNAVKDQIVELGRAPIDWLLQGMELQWPNVTAWWHEQLAKLPAIPNPLDAFNESQRREPLPGGERSGGGGGGRRTSNLAMGGPLGRGWTLVGEAGPELINPQGLVIPHGASMARLRGWLPGFAMGGWADWVAGQSREGRRQLRLARDQGLTAEERRGLMSGELTIAEDGSIVSSSYYGRSGRGGGGSGRTAGRQGVFDRKQDFLAGLTQRQRDILHGLFPEGIPRNILGSLMSGGTSVRDLRVDWLAGQREETRTARGAERATDRTARQARDAADRADRVRRDRTRPTPTDELDVGRDRASRATDSMATFGGSRREERLGNLMSFDDFRKYRRTAAREDRAAEIAPIAIYGNVNLYPVDGDVHAAIATQLATRAR